MMINTPIIIWGASGHAKVLAEFLPCLGYRIISLFDNLPIVSPIEGVPCYHGKEGFLNWKKNVKALEQIKFLVAIGGSRGKERADIQNYLISEGLRPATVIHPTAFVAKDAKIGEGTQILAQAAVCAGVKVGKACIINTKASVDHESIIGNGVHIAPGVTIAGCVIVGDYSFIALGSKVLPRLEIGKNSVIGANALVTKNVLENVVVIGQPAKFYKNNNIQ